MISEERRWLKENGEARRKELNETNFVRAFKIDEKESSRTAGRSSVPTECVAVRTS